MTAISIETTVNSKYDLEQIVDSMMLAFNSDPFLRWIYPSQEQYLASFPEFVKLLDNSMIVHYIKDSTGAAFWLPPEKEIEEDMVGTYLQKTVSPQDLEKIFAVFEKLKQVHPQDPHWYLVLLGVEPLKQGQGYGSALIEPALLECDRTKQIAYLETCNPKSAAFYQRRGFELQEIIQIADCPEIYPMVRCPQ